ncbi:multiple antibiotic resistance regulatory protein MarB [Cronobacter muytjensii]|uniref:multiple antibiotic resistance regulatory protein MarB n=1 Tax=Cronobacter muytjensii TaxID=413501 RepID=UPI0029FE8B5F|nr:multiple antibiotic resistance regulatory periplasmic protein MarB [Cronobacter muytjensii]
MKSVTRATVLFLALTSGYALAGSPTADVCAGDHSTMTVPIEHHESLDLSHRSAGSDKSDELAVPYYN